MTTDLRTLQRTKEAHPLVGILQAFGIYAVGFVPGYASIGIGIGGEWGWAMLVAMARARTNAHRGFVS